MKTLRPSISEPKATIYLGDCLSVLKDVPDNSIDLIATDPPYRTTSRGSCGNSGGMFRKEINLKGKTFKYNDIDCQQYAPEFYRVLKEDSHLYVMTNHRNLINMLNTFTDLRTQLEKDNRVKPYGFHFVKSLIWNKSNKIMSQFYMSQFEYILFFRKGKSVKINNCSTSDILDVPNKKSKDSNGKNLHDTEKPVELMKILIENSSLMGEVVLDPFMGIGTTGIACINTRRNFIGIEVDKQYFSIAKDRLSEIGCTPIIK